MAELVVLATLKHGARLRRGRPRHQPWLRLPRLWRYIMASAARMRGSSVVASPGATRA